MIVPTPFINEVQALSSLLHPIFRQGMRSGLKCSSLWWFFMSFLFSAGTSVFSYGVCHRIDFSKTWERGGDSYRAWEVVHDLQYSHFTISSPFKNLWDCRIKILNNECQDRYKYQVQVPLQVYVYTYHVFVCCFGRFTSSIKTFNFC